MSPNFNTRYKGNPNGHLIQDILEKLVADPPDLPGFFEVVLIALGKSALVIVEKKLKEKVRFNIKMNLLYFHF
jgi:hypothetical protein